MYKKRINKDGFKKKTVRGAVVIVKLAKGMMIGRKPVPISVH